MVSYVGKGCGDPVGCLCRIAKARTSSAANSPSKTGSVVLRGAISHTLVSGSFRATRQSMIPICWIATTATVTTTAVNAAIPAHRRARAEFAGAPISRKTGAVTNGNEHEEHRPEPRRQEPDSVRFRYEQPDRPDPRGRYTELEQQKKGGHELAEWRQLELHETSLCLLSFGVKPPFGDSEPCRLSGPEIDLRKAGDAEGLVQLGAVVDVVGEDPLQDPAASVDSLLVAPLGDGSPRRACRGSIGPGSSRRCGTLSPAPRRAPRRRVR